MSALPRALDLLYSLPGCAAGGPLHIVIDDGNVDDHHLDFCAEQMAADEWEVEVVEACEAVLALLREVPAQRRLAAIEEA